MCNLIETMVRGLVVSLAGPVGGSFLPVWRHMQNHNTPVIIITGNGTASAGFKLLLKLVRGNRFGCQGYRVWLPMLQGLVAKAIGYRVWLPMLQGLVAKATGLVQLLK